MSWKKGKFFLGGGILLLVVSVVGGYFFYRQTHFLQGAHALGEDISGKTVAQAYTLLNKVNQPLDVSIKNGTETYVVKVPKRVLLSKKILEKQLKEKEIKLPKNPKFMHELTTAFSVIDFHEQLGENAKLRFNGDSWEIVPEVKSTKIHREQLIQAISKESASKKMHEFELSRFFIPVEISASNAKLQERLKFANHFIRKQVSLDVNGKNVSLTKELMNSFLTEAGEVNAEKIENYLTQTLNPEVSTLNKEVLWKNPSNGKTYKYLNNYAWGWDIRLNEAIQLLVSELVKPENPQKISLPIDGDAKASETISDNYVWINLLDQTMHVYRNGSEVISTRIISGRNDKRTATVPGFHTIGYRRENTNLEGTMLDGSHYSVHVNYFEPLQSRGNNGAPYYTGIGIHDSVKIYDSVDSWKTLAGSNGCINTPPGIMGEVWAQTYVGMPVIITGDLYVNSPEDYNKPVDFGVEV